MKHVIDSTVYRTGEDKMDHVFLSHLISVLLTLWVLWMCLSYFSTISIPLLIFQVFDTAGVLCWAWPLCNWVRNCCWSCSGSDSPKEMSRPQNSGWREVSVKERGECTPFFKSSVISWYLDVSQTAGAAAGANLCEPTLKSGEVS